MRFCCTSVQPDLFLTSNSTVNWFLLCDSGDSEMSEVLAQWGIRKDKRLRMTLRSYKLRVYGWSWCKLLSAVLKAWILRSLTLAPKSQKGAHSQHQLNQIFSSILSKHEELLICVSPGFCCDCIWIHIRPNIHKHQEGAEPKVDRLEFLIHADSAYLTSQQDHYKNEQGNLYVPSLKVISFWDLWHTFCKLS